MHDYAKPLGIQIGKEGFSSSWLFDHAALMTLTQQLTLRRQCRRPGQQVAAILVQLARIATQVVLDRRRLQTPDGLRRLRACLGILLCRSAIEQGAPYGTWTEDMSGVLGESQTITFTFFYR